jgi:2-phosphosulfolactate phosphatase
MCLPPNPQRRVDVAFTREGIERADLLIVLDVLRATSTIVSALAAGYRRVLCVDTIERARGLAAPGRTLAGEQRWVRPDGFALGNSPLDVREPSGEELVLATTNGSATIVRAAAHADTVLIGALLNLDAVVAAAEGAGDVQVVCSGASLRPALEDVYAAGRIAQRLDGARTDAAEVACAVAYGDAPAEAVLGRSAGAAALRERGMGDDVAWCARESVLPIVPRVSAAEEHLATISKFQ